MFCSFCGDYIFPDEPFFVEGELYFHTQIAFADVICCLTRKVLEIIGG